MRAGNLRATRAVVISDIHLANGQPDMVSNPAVLTQFINQLPSLFPVDNKIDEKLELVIAGDFIDYLNIQEYSAWTGDPAQAVKKLTDVTDRSQFAPVFDALAQHVRRGHRLTILLGNHDVELALPQVQDALLCRLGASPHEVLYVMDGRAYRLGSARIEHGNRYDDANANDWTGLRAIVSALSRNESPTVDLEISAGSKLVIKVVNPLKDTYPFVNLLQPVGEILLLLLLEFEPSLAWQVDMLGRLLNSKRLAERNKLGQQPGATRNVSAQADAAREAPDDELLTLFGDTYRQLHSQASKNVAAGDVLSLLVRPGRDGLAAYFERQAPVPIERLRKIRAALKRIIDNDKTDNLDIADGPCGAAAKRLLQSPDVQAVVMGHTHLPRYFRCDDGVYLNSGTWIDRLRIPHHVLAEGAERELEAYLRDLKEDRRSPCPPTCAELRIDETAAVRASALHEVLLSQSDVALRTLKGATS